MQERFTYKIKVYIKSLVHIFKISAYHLERKEGRSSTDHLPKGGSVNGFGVDCVVA